MFSFENGVQWYSCPSVPQSSASSRQDSRSDPFFRSIMHTLADPPSPSPMSTALVAGAGPTEHQAHSKSSDEHKRGRPGSFAFHAKIPRSHPPCRSQWVSYMNVRDGWVRTLDTLPKSNTKLAAQVCVGLLDHNSTLVGGCRSSTRCSIPIHHQAGSSGPLACPDHGGYQ